MFFRSARRALAVGVLCSLAAGLAIGFALGRAERLRPYDAGASTVIDWSKGDAQHTTATCGAFSFSGMKDGGTYELYVNSKKSGTCSFSNSDAPRLTFRLPPNFGATDDGSSTMFRFSRLGTDVVVEWMPGV